jgi:hypothetical protein
MALYDQYIEESQISRRDSQEDSKNTSNYHGPLIGHSGSTRATNPGIQKNATRLVRVGAEAHKTR